MELAETWAGWVAACVGAGILVVTAVLGGIHGTDTSDGMGNGVVLGDPGAWAGAGLLALHPESDSFGGFVRGSDVVPDVPVAPVPVQPVPTEAPTPVVPFTPLEALSDIERAICSVGWPDCAKALRVARCESGPDYFAGWAAHVGTFQISPIHAWRFTRLGLDYWVHGSDPYYNSAVAFWIYKDAGGWGPWPWCGRQ